MTARINLEGKRFGRWEVLRYIGANCNKQTVYLCRCDCGNERVVVAQTLRAGLTSSCGCMKGQAISSARTIHGHSRVKSTGEKDSRTYQTWMAMHNRCRGGTPDGRKYYVRYGIKVCERWSDFANFLADMGEAPLGKSLDRYPDKEGNYGPDNCRWATPAEQGQNKRPYAPQGPRGPRKKRPPVYPLMSTVVICAA